jgi:hypothetical protein
MQAAEVLGRCLVAWADEGCPDTPLGKLNAGDVSCSPFDGCLQQYQPLLCNSSFAQLKQRDALPESVLTFLHNFTEAVALAAIGDDPSPTTDIRAAVTNLLSELKTGLHIRALEDDDEKEWKCRMTALASLSLSDAALSNAAVGSLSKILRLAFTKDALDVCIDENPGASCNGIDCGRGGKCAQTSCECAPGFFGTFCKPRSDNESAMSGRFRGSATTTTVRVT